MTSRRGVSLVELMVTMALLSFVMLMALEFMVEGVRYYRNADFSLDLQRNSLVAMGVMSRDLGETDPSAYYCNNDTTVDKIGILAASPRDSNSKLVFSSNNGRLLYSSAICIWFDQPNHTIVRTQTFFLPSSTTPSPFQQPPPVGPNVSWTANPPDPPGIKASIDDFASQNSLIDPLSPGGGTISAYDSRIVARFVTNFSPTVSNVTLNNINISSRPISLVMTCGQMDSATAGKNAYEVTLNTTIYPKN